MSSKLVVKDHAEEATVDRQPVVIAVIDKAMFPEPVHEMTDPGPGRADHLCQAILTDSGDYGFSLAILAKMRKQQENSSQTLLARVEKLVDEILFVSDVA